MILLASDQQHVDSIRYIRYIINLKTSEHIIYYLTCCIIIFLTGVTALVADSPRALAKTTGVKSVEYNFWRQSIPIMVVRLCRWRSVS